MIRLALLDDHPAVLVGLQRVIEQEPDIVIVGAAPSSPELARRLGTRRADVLVVDHDVARSDGLSQCRRIKDRPQPPAVIIYSAFARQTLALSARGAHADALRAEADEIAWRAQRLIGRLRPGATSRPDERELESGGGRVPELPFR